jgi:hypothetical protein
MGQGKGRIARLQRKRGVGKWLGCKARGRERDIKLKLKLFREMNLKN